MAAEALLLAEQGELDLDAPASTYLPVPQLANGATMRHLLGHRAGIPDPGQEPYERAAPVCSSHPCSGRTTSPSRNPKVGAHARDGKARAGYLRT